MGDGVLPKLRILIKCAEWKSVVVHITEKVMPVWEGYKRMFEAPSITFRGEPAVYNPHASQPPPPLQVMNLETKKEMVGDINLEDLLPPPNFDTDGLMIIGPGPTPGPSGGPAFPSASPGPAPPSALPASAPPSPTPFHAPIPAPSAPTPAPSAPVPTTIPTLPVAAALVETVNPSDLEPPVATPPAATPPAAIPPAVTPPAGSPTPSSPATSEEGSEKDFQMGGIEQDTEMGGVEQDTEMGGVEQDTEMELETEVIAKNKGKGKEVMGRERVKRARLRVVDSEDEDEAMTPPPPNQKVQGSSGQTGVSKRRNIFENLDEDVLHGLNSQGTLSGRMSHVDIQRVIGTLLGLEDGELKYVLGLDREVLLSKISDMVPKNEKGKRKEGQVIKSPVRKRQRHESYTPEFGEKLMSDSDPVDESGSESGSGSEYDGSN